MRHQLWVSALVGVFLLGACSSTEWVHRYKKKEAFVIDYNQCDREVANRVNSQMITPSQLQQQGMMEQCLQKQGWVKKTPR
jgi:hypothetical protein